VRSIYADVGQLLHEYIAELSRKLKESKARWKIVFAHHPIYTKGRGHAVEGRALKVIFKLIFSIIYIKACC
jgi:hypothetical protein